MAIFSSLRLLLLRKGVAFTTIAKIPSAAGTKFNPPRAWQQTNAVPPTEESLPQLPVVALQNDCWNPWPANASSIVQIEERLNIQEDAFVSHLVLCIRNGHAVDWVSLCRRVNLTPSMVEMLKDAYSEARDPHYMPLEGCRFSCHMTYKQWALFVVMKCSGIDYQGIHRISSAATVSDNEVQLTGNVAVDACPQFSDAWGLAGRRKVEAYGDKSRGQFLKWQRSNDGMKQREQWESICRGNFSLESAQTQADQKSFGRTDIFQKWSRQAVLPDERLVSKEIVDMQLPYQAAWMMGVADSELTTGKRTVQITCEEGLLIEDVEALHLLVERGLQIDTLLIYNVLRRCTLGKNLLLGMRAHRLLLQLGYETNTFLANHLICMYASHGRLDETRQVFAKVAAPDCYMWASIILAHARHGQPEEAITFYQKCLDSSVKPDSRVFVAVLKACAAAGDLKFGKQVHANLLSSKIKPDVFVSTCLVDMYSKCRSIDDARKVFDAMPAKNVVTWTAMITGYAQNELSQEALALYQRMQLSGMTPADRVTYVCLLQACAGAGAFLQGKQLHAQIQQKGLETDVVIGSCLVDMYAKCGNLTKARKVFHRLPTKNVVTWSALMNGFAQHGESQLAFQCFKHMQQQGIKPNDTTFLCLLVACSLEGLVDEGQQVLKSMVDDHGIVPSVHHYNCLVDLLGRSGRLDEAENVLRCMPYQNDVVGWTSLLNACKRKGDFERAERCFDLLITLGDESSAAYAYVLLSAMYAAAGRWADADRVERLRKSAGAAKKPAKACIEVQNKVHEFRVGEERADTSSKLKSMNLKFINDGSNMPHTELVLRVRPERAKDDALCGHAEKLALAYGLLNTPDGTPLLVTKNLRMCHDCHSSTKAMSKVEGRDIVVRDAHRVHRFVNGYCSCRDRQ